MATDILLPKLGFTMAEGTITEWLAHSGDTVRQGQPLFLLEAEKALEEVEAPASGTLTVLVQAGEAAEVGALIGRID
jgi:pyruvate/2-oxoglutarate dehydrogenase complex dihydrolipoamide acyltransferase (E2) component